MDSTGSIRHRSIADFARRTVVVVLVAAVILAVVVVFWYLIEVLLLVFAGILAAIFLRGLSEFLESHTRIRGGWALATVVLTLLAALTGVGFLLAPSLIDQAGELVATIPEAWRQLLEQLREIEWAGQPILDGDPFEFMQLPADIFPRVLGVFSSIAAVIAGLFFVTFVGLYFAANSQIYIDGLLHLFPKESRGRVCEVLSAVRYTLLWWLMGQGVVMAFVGISTAIGLALLNIPLALTLGIVAGLLDFIPYIGPIVASIPAILVALMQSPRDALSVLILYVVVQQVESYVVAPMVHRKTVRLQPALTIFAQVSLGVLLGAIGVVLATPLTAALLVIVKMTYVHDTLGDDIEVPDVEETGLVCH